MNSSVPIWQPTNPIKRCCPQRNFQDFFWHILPASLSISLSNTSQVVLLLVILVMRKRIAFAVELFHQAGKAISAMPLLLFQPFWTFLTLLIFFVYVAAVFVAIAATGTPCFIWFVEVKNLNCKSDCWYTKWLEPTLLKKISMSLNPVYLDPIIWGCCYANQDMSYNILQAVSSSGSVALDTFSKLIAKGQCCDGIWIIWRSCGLSKYLCIKCNSATKLVRKYLSCLKKSMWSRKV